MRPTAIMRRFPCVLLLASLAVGEDAPAAAATPAPAAGAGATATADAVDAAAILAAARAADLEYQRRFALMREDLRSPDEALRLHTIRRFGRMDDPAAVPLLMPFLEASTRSNAELQAAAVALGHLGAVPAEGALRKLLPHPDETVRATAHNALSQLQAIQQKDYVNRANDPDDAIRGSSVANIGTFKMAEAAEVLAKALANDRKPLHRRLAAIGLGRLGNKAHGPLLAEALTDGDPLVRRYAAEALVKLDYKPAIPNLLMALEANVAGNHIVRCVKLLTGQDFGFDPRSDIVKRTDAIERAFVWWSANAKELTAGQQ